MKRISIVQTRNGWLILSAEVKDHTSASDIPQHAWSFNSLDKAIAQTRKIMKSWFEIPQPKP